MTDGPFDILLANGDFLQKSSALVLNADFRPLSYFPLSLWTWQDSIKASISNRVNILAEYDEVVRSPSVEIKIPSVVVLKEIYVPIALALSHGSIYFYEMNLNANIVVRRVK